MGWFSRRGDRPQDPQQIVDQAAVADPMTVSADVTEPPSAAEALAQADDFTMSVEDVFSITGRGTVVTGVVAAGEVAVGQDVTHLRDGETLRTVRVTGIEMVRTMVDSAHAGDNIGILVTGVKRHEITHGDQLFRRAS